MRRAKDVVAESRRRIVVETGRLVRERGLAAVSVSDLMAAAGLTHGGFYRHFDSRDALIGEALEDAFATIGEGFDRDAEAGGSAAALDAYIARYLSPAHVADPGIGCPLAALGGEVARAPEIVRNRFRQGCEGLIARLAAALGGGDAGRMRAHALIAALAGAVIAARTTPEDAPAVLAAARAAAAQVLARHDMAPMA